MQMNYFLLTHKCGNNYIINAHAICKTVPLLSVTPKEISAIKELKQESQVNNIRCRNFHSKLFETCEGIGTDNRYVLFTRDPASFVLSAVAYHLRGNEKWALETPQEILGGIPLTTALKEAKSKADAQITIMKFFTNLYDAQTSWLGHLEKDNFLRIRCEDLFTCRRPSYYYSIAKFLGLHDRPEFTYSLMAASPAFSSHLPGHSTGKFKIRHPYLSLEPEAREYFDQNFIKYSHALGYATSEAVDTSIKDSDDENASIQTEVPIVWEIAQFFQNKALPKDEIDRITRERDHARRYPWKYLRSALSDRIS